MISNNNENVIKKKAINDSELETKSEYDDVQGLIAAAAAAEAEAEAGTSTPTNDEMIYSTPSNKLIERPAADGDDRSVLRLVQHDSNETQA